MTDDMTLIADDLEITYHVDGSDVTAVDGVSFKIRRGAAVGLVGESGSGKTTVGNAILRSLPPGAKVHGRVSLGGFETTALSDAAFLPLRWREVAMVFQNALEALNPVYTVGHQLMDVLIVRGGASRRDAERRVKDLFRQVDLDEHWLHRYPHELSGGMKQRVMIAMALLCQPRLVIADEPTTALDVIVRQQIIELLGRVREQTDVSLLVISHDLDMIGRVCDDVAVMYAGHIVEYGSRDDVLTRPQHPYTQALLAAYPKLSGPIAQLEALPGNPPRPGAFPTGCRFRDRCPLATDLCATSPQARGAQDHWALCHYAGEAIDER